jgi:hypothetical protein
MSIKLVVPALLLAGFSVFGQGCNQTCDQLCAETAYYIDGCLEGWDALWSDFGYDGLVTEDVDGVSVEVSHGGGPAGEYLDSCRSRYSEALGRGVPDDQAVLRGKCAEDLQDLAISVGCYEYRPNGASLDPTAD